MFDPSSDPIPELTDNTFLGLLHQKGDRVQPGRSVGARLPRFPVGAGFARRPGRAHPLRGTLVQLSPGPATDGVEQRVTAGGELTQSPVLVVEQASIVLMSDGRRESKKEIGYSMRQLNKSISAIYRNQPYYSIQDQIFIISVFLSN